MFRRGRTSLVLIVLLIAQHPWTTWNPSKHFMQPWVFQTREEEHFTIRQIKQTSPKIPLVQLPLNLESVLLCVFMKLYDTATIKTREKHALPKGGNPKPVIIVINFSGQVLVNLIYNSAFTS